VIGYAATVPRMTLAGATTLATSNELRMAPRRFSSPSASWYHFVVKPLQGNEKTMESLNENTASMTSGP
jgi:hypothetical protein